MNYNKYATLMQDVINKEKWGMDNMGTFCTTWINFCKYKAALKNKVLIIFKPAYVDRFAIVFLQMEMERVKWKEEHKETLHNIPLDCLNFLQCTALSRAAL